MPNIRHTVRQIDNDQIRAAVKGGIADRNNSVRDRDRPQRRFVLEGIAPDRRHGIAVDGRGNEDRTGAAVVARDRRVVFLVEGIGPYHDRLPAASRVAAGGVPHAGIEVVRAWIRIVVSGIDAGLGLEGRFAGTVIHQLPVLPVVVDADRAVFGGVDIDRLGVGFHMRHARIYAGLGVHPAGLIPAGLGRLVLIIGRLYTHDAADRAPQAGPEDLDINRGGGLHAQLARHVRQDRERGPRIASDQTEAGALGICHANAQSAFPGQGERPGHVVFVDEREIADAVQEGDRTDLQRAARADPCQRAGNAGVLIRGPVQDDRVVLLLLIDSRVQRDVAQRGDDVRGKAADRNRLVEADASLADRPVWVINLEPGRAGLDLEPVLPDIGGRRARLEIDKIRGDDTLVVDILHGVFRALGRPFDPVMILFQLNGFRKEGDRQVSVIDDKYVAGFQADARVVDQDGVLIILDRRPHRENDHAVGKLRRVVMAFVDLLGSPDLGRVGEHGVRLVLGDRLLGQKLPADQRKPTAVHRQLRLKGVRHRVRKGIALFFLRLEAQAVDQRRRREIARRRVVRAEGLAGLQVDHAEFHRHHDVAVECVLGVDVAVIVVGIVVRFDRHAEDLDQGRDPVRAAHGGCFAPVPLGGGRRGQHAQQHDQRHQQGQASLPGVSHVCFLPFCLPPPVRAGRRYVFRKDRFRFYTTLYFMRRRVCCQA